MARTNDRTPEQGNPLGDAPVVGLICKFAIPSIISMLVNAAYNITDQIFIGHVVGMLGNAATNVAFPTVTLTMAFAQLVGIGTASNFNISLGAKREEDAKHFIGTGLALMPVLGILIMSLVLLFKMPVLRLCGATENVLPYARLYLGVTALGIPFFLFSSAGSFLIRADGSPTYSMACTVTGAALNVFLDWLFMFRFRWGIQGAALATVTGQVISFLLCLFYFTRFKTFKITMRMLRVRWQYVTRIAKLGTSKSCRAWNSSNSKAFPSRGRRYGVSPDGCGMKQRVATQGDPYGAGQGSDGSLCRSSSAARTAATTKAEKVQFCPTMTSSTASITSFGNRMDLFVVAGCFGI